MNKKGNNFVSLKMRVEYVFMSLKVRAEYIFMSLKMLTAVLKTAILSVWRDKNAHNAICDFYAHMARNRERRFARCFCRYFHA